MQFGPNLNSFSLKLTLEEMIISEKISMKDIYEAYKIYKKNGNKSLPFEVNFFDCEKNFFCFKIGGKYGYNILDEPIEIEVDDKKISIVCDSQINFLKETYKIDTLYCYEENSSYFISAANLLSHKNHQYSIVKSDSYEIFKDQNEIDEYLEKFKEGFLQKLFDTPKHFEKNFEYYFNINNKQKYNYQFYIYDDAESSDRRNLVNNILNWEFGTCYYFYGSSGKGKSVTLIGALKYGEKDESVGTFYVNCKTLRILYKKYKIEIMKQILIDEIVFIFRKNYDKYKECCEEIKNFIFKNEYDFWILIENILDVINNIKNLKCIIAFDQYNDENDINSKLNKIKSKFLSDEIKKFRILVFSSMNETDIRSKKIDSLIHQKIIPNSMEITNICSKFHTDFNEEENEVFNLLGKTMKAYNEIYQRKNKLICQTLDDYIYEKKKKIKFKMFCFYQDISIRKEIFYDKNSVSDFTKCIGKILSFVPKEIYSQTDIEKKINNVPLRFFNVKKKKKNTCFYIIEYAFPLIEQILIEIYKDIILNEAYSVIKKIIGESGALGCVFEYAVINCIIQKEHVFNNKLFGFFKISKNLKVKKFVLNDNEKEDKIIYKTYELDKISDYIIEQEVFGGKALDFIIIHFENGMPNVYGFQVSVFKQTIFTIEELKKSYLSMIGLLKKYFGIDFEKRDMYFGYIFNYEDILTNKYNKLLNDCTKRNFKYCFFNPEEQKFLNQFGKEITNINDIVSKVFQDISLDIKISDSDNFVFKRPKLEMDINCNIVLNQKQKTAINKIIEQRYGKKFGWKIIQTTSMDDFIHTYINNKNYFYLIYNFPCFKAVFFENYIIYKIKEDGQVEEDTILDNKKDIHVCEVIKELDDFKFDDFIFDENKFPL